MPELVRVIGSLAVVLALMWVAARLLRRTATGRATGAIEVLARQQLSRSASLAVVRVGERALVVGVADGQVSLLTETELDAVRAPGPSPARETREAVLALPGTTPTHGTTPTPGSMPTGGPAVVRPGRLTGSALSPATWRTAVEVLRERTARRA